MHNAQYKRKVRGIFFVSFLPFSIDDVLALKATTKI